MHRFDIPQYNEAAQKKFQHEFILEHEVISDHISPFETIQNFQFCKKVLGKVLSNIGYCPELRSLLILHKRI